MKEGSKNSVAKEPECPIKTYCFPPKEDKGLPAMRIDAASMADAQRKYKKAVDELAKKAKAKESPKTTEV